MFDVLSLVHKHHPLKQVVSGGQTGADFAGGVAAEALGIAVVMTFPDGYLQRTLTEYSYTQTEQDVLDEVERQAGDLQK